MSNEIITQQIMPPGMLAVGQTGKNNVNVTNQQGGIRSIDQKSWIFLILSGLATGASWLCYYKALQIGEASKVVPVDKLSVVITLVLVMLIFAGKL